MSDFRYFLTDKDGNRLEVFPSEEFDNRVFVFDMNEARLHALASTASLLPDDHLQSWLNGFVEQEKYEEAAIIKKEMDGRNRTNTNVRVSQNAAPRPE